MSAATDERRSATVWMSGPKATAMDLSPAQNVLFACLRRLFGAGDVSLLEAISEPGFTWEALAGLAQRYEVESLLYSSLAASVVSLPEHSGHRLRANYLAELVRLEVVVEPTVRQVLEALNGQGFAPVLLKGAALAYGVYPEPVHRSFVDIDLLLPGNQLEEAKDVLDRMGFCSRGEAQPSHHLQAVYRPDGWIGVELHTALLSEPHPYRIDVDQLRARSQMAGVAGIDTRVLSPTDALVFTCLHLSYAHRYRRSPLRHLVDILAISTTYIEQIDWELLQETTRYARASGAVFWPLHFARSWIGAPIPEHVLADLSPPSRLPVSFGALASPAHILDGDVPALSRPFYQFLHLAALHAGSPRRTFAVALGRGVRNALRSR